MAPLPASPGGGAGCGTAGAAVEGVAVGTLVGAGGADDGAGDGAAAVGAGVGAGCATVGGAACDADGTGGGEDCGADGVAVGGAGGAGVSSGGAVPFQPAQTTNETASASTITTTRQPIGGGVVRAMGAQDRTQTLIRECRPPGSVHEGRCVARDRRRAGGQQIIRWRWW